MEQGDLGILNVGAGDLKLSFRPDEPEESLALAAKTVGDMLRQGYALFIEKEDGTYTRVQGFDPQHRVYIITQAPIKDTEVRPKKKAVTKKNKVRVPASRVRGVAVARSAGG